MRYMDHKPFCKGPLVLKVKGNNPFLQNDNFVGLAPSGKATARCQPPSPRSASMTMVWLATPRPFKEISALVPERLAETYV